MRARFPVESSAGTSFQITFSGGAIEAARRRAAVVFTVCLRIEGVTMELPNFQLHYQTPETNTDKMYFKIFQQERNSSGHEGGARSIRCNYIREGASSAGESGDIRIGFGRRVQREPDVFLVVVGSVSTKTRRGAACSSEATQGRKVEGHTWPVVTLTCLSTGLQPEKALTRTYTSCKTGHKLAHITRTRFMQDRRFTGINPLVSRSEAGRDDLGRNLPTGWVRGDFQCVFRDPHLSYMFNVRSRSYFIRENRVHLQDSVSIPVVKTKFLD
ncbi:hypothetical protein EVAR_71627_1 [Eumeta japonica]|uniref:Uncharacterized protein n=1 Tax=Eumeta variegata TaxID=151549 RepID=A0A4C2A958_EUMVA|nr:hypothetical protein EVAR_71627_1 [Eumeta japonica]